MALAGFLLLAAIPAGARQSGPVVTISGEPSGWKDRARLVMDHDSLASALRDGGYYFAANAEIYLAELVPGVGQSALMTYDAGQGAFSQDFWPALTPAGSHGTSILCRRRARRRAAVLCTI